MVTKLIEILNTGAELTTSGQTKDTVRITITNTAGTETLVDERNRANDRGDNHERAGEAWRKHAIRNRGFV